jgi:hypothetical protein
MPCVVVNMSGWRRLTGLDCKDPELVPAGHNFSDQERRILEEVNAANLRLDELRTAVSDSLGVRKRADVASEQGTHTTLLPLASGEDKKAEDKAAARMSSMVKRVVEATGHGLDGLLEAVKPV